MYEAFYGLSAEPFRLTPDHRFSFSHRSYARAKAYLEYGVRRAEGFVMITGRPGTGKTTLINDLLDGLENAGVSIARLVSTQVEAGELLRLVAFSFGLDAEGVDKATLLRRLEMFLREDLQAGRRAVLIVDEAQDVSAGALEELRLLTNLVHQGQPLLQVFLVGQEELRSVVHSKPLEQLHQRLIAACHLEPLSLRETRAYIQYRLKRVGWQDDPAFDDTLYEGVHAFSLGVPRRINQVCSRLLLHGFVEEKHRLDASDLDAVLTDLREEMLNPWDEDPDTPGRRAPAPESAEDRDFEFDPADLNPPRISEEEEPKKKDLLEPDGLTLAPEPPSLDLGEPLPPDPPDGVPDGDGKLGDGTADESGPAAREAPDETSSRDTEPPPRTVPLARIATIKVPAHQARPGTPDSGAHGARQASARSAVEDNAMFADPKARLDPEETAAPVRTGTARRGGAALVVVLGVLALILGVLVLGRTVSGPWSPELDRAESWLREGWDGMRADFSSDFLPPPPASPTAAANTPDKSPSVPEPALRVASAVAEPPFDRPAGAEPARAPESRAEAGEGGRFDLFAVARAAYAPDASAEEEAASDEEVLSQVQRSLREQLADVGLKLWRQGDGSLYLDFIDPISFGSDSATLATEYARVLARVSDVLRAYPAVSVRLVGWTDTRGDPIYNQKLSEQRAGAVAEWLRAQGLQPERLEVEGRGSVTPGLFDPHASRRVDLYLKAP